jgi:hypothetical protein
MKMRLTFLAVWSLSVALNAQTSGTIDLTQTRASSSAVAPTAKGVVSATGISSHAERRRPPLALTLEWMDRQSFRYGEPFTFRVILHNAGARGDCKSMGTRFVSFIIDLGRHSGAVA